MKPTLPRVGERVGGYVVGEELARGGMGAVFRARRVEDGLEVALKVLLGTDATRQARFAREGEVGRLVKHPAIVRVLDQGVHGGVSYLVMELVTGALTLTSFCRAHQLDDAARIRLWLRLAEGVQAAHDEGLIHRDLKPDNLLVDSQGTPKVVDFGLARHLDRERLTRTGAVMGTIAYMAPEQARGAGAHADARADVFALAVILYELLTGKLPFDTSEGAIQTLNQIISAEAPPLSDSNPEAAALDPVLAKAMTKSPEERYPTVRAFARDVASVLKGSAPVAQVEARQRRRVGRARTLGALLAACALLGGAVAWVASRERELDPGEQRALARELRAEAWAITEAEDFLSSARAQIDALSERVDEGMTQARPPHERELSEAIAEVEALRLLARLRSDPTDSERGERVARAQALVERTSEGRLVEVLRAALEIDAERASDADVRVLARARARGALALDLSMWRARGLGQLSPGLLPRSVAEEVEQDLARVASARPLSPRERALRARAALGQGEVDRARKALAQLSPESARQPWRWRAALELVARDLERAPEEALKTLASLSTPGPELKQRGPLARAAASAAELALRDPQDVKRGVERAWTYVQIEQRLARDPSASKRLAVQRILEHVTSVRTGGAPEIAGKLAALFPEDAELQVAVGSLTPRIIPITAKRLLLPALRRAIQIVPEGSKRDFCRLVLCAELADVADKYDHHTNAAELRECLTLVAQLLPRAKGSQAADALIASARAKRRLGDLKGALADHALARRAFPAHPLHDAFEAFTLQLLGRKQEAYDLCVRFSSGRIDTSAINERAIVRIWELGRELGHYDSLFEQLDIYVNRRPDRTGWHVRRAWAWAKLHASEGRKSVDLLAGARTRVELGRTFARSRDVLDVYDTYLKELMAHDAKPLEVLGRFVEALERMRGERNVP